jgi:hypothetical protein
MRSTLRGRRDAHRITDFQVRALTTDVFGDVYAAVIQTVRRTVWLSYGKRGSEPISESQADTFVLKYGADGALLWQLRYRGFSLDVIATDGAGNLYGAGRAAVEGGKSDFFVIQYDREGVERWYRQSGGAEDDYVRDLRVAADGSVRVLTETYGASSDVAGSRPGAASIASYDASGVESVSQLVEYAGYTAGFFDFNARANRFDAAGIVYQMLRDPAIRSSELHSELQICHEAERSCIQLASIADTRLLGFAARTANSVLSWATQTPNDGRNSSETSAHFLVEYRSDLEVRVLQPLPVAGAELVSVDARGSLFAAGCELPPAGGCYVTKIPLETLR